jgi:DNA-binding transcriptional LysR family regulator
MLSPVRVRDGESALEAVLAGLGKSLIPVTVGDRDSRLLRAEDEGDGSVLSRELWLLGHEDLMDREYIRAVIQWITDTLSA